MLDGRLTVQVDDESYELEPGATVTISPGAAHTFAVTTPSARFLGFTLTGGAGRLFADIVASSGGTGRCLRSSLYCSRSHGATR